MMTFEKPDKIKFVLRTFTNDEIEALLEAGENFRDINTRQRDKYAEAMRQGWWDPGTGETIAMDVDGALVNGQHRLSAAAIVQRETGKLIWFWVAMGVAGRAARSMDQGLSRRVIDYMEKEGVTHAKFQAGIAAAVARKMMTRSDTSLFSVCVSAGGNGKSPGIGFVMDTWKRNRGAIQTWAEFAAKLQNAGFPRSTLVASLLYHFAKQDDTRAKLFGDYLLSGGGMRERDPVLVLRERLRSEKSSKAKLSSQHLGAIIVKAWVAWNEEREITSLRWASTGPAAEAFPDHRYTVPA